MISTLTEFWYNNYIWPRKEPGRTFRLSIAVVVCGKKKAAAAGTSYGGGDAAVSAGIEMERGARAPRRDRLTMFKTHERYRQSCGSLMTISI